MVWQEIFTAQKEKRHEIILSGNEISERIQKDGLDDTIFELANLNYLKISDTVLTEIPDQIHKLDNLQTLVLYSNKIEKLSNKLLSLSKLKVLDLSRNCLKSIPAEISELLQLVTVNVSDNSLEMFPMFSKNSKLSVLNLSNNKLQEFPDVCYAELTNLSELYLSGNSIEVIPAKINQLTNLKTFHVNSNKIKLIPGELADCNKLKEVKLQDNPITDKRLLKLVVQCHNKQILDYINKQCPRSSSPTNKTAKKGRKVSNSDSIDKENGVEKTIKDALYKITVKHFNENFNIIVEDAVKDVRQHIIACIVLNLEFTEESFKKFIQVQTKLHDTICDKRNAATIATHDLQKLGEGNLTYTAVAPNELVIKPLNRSQTMTGAQLFSQLQTEANNLRKEKKRSTYSGIHKYLYLLEGRPKYPCVKNGAGAVVSFPPITNSDNTKMSIETKSLLIEVTSATSQHICKKVAETLIKEMVPLFGKTLTVQQVRNVNNEGTLKAVYPSRLDLVYEDHAGILVERE